MQVRIKELITKPEYFFSRTVKQLFEHSKSFKSKIINKKKYHKCVDQPHNEVLMIYKTKTRHVC